MAGPVTMLTKPQCMQCTMTARKLDEAGVTYTTIDITESDAALEWAQDHQFMAAPIVVVGDMDTEDFDAWTGFRPDKLAALKGEQEYEQVEQEDEKVEQEDEYEDVDKDPGGSRPVVAGAPGDRVD